MLKWPRLFREPDDVHAVLVEELFAGPVPVAIMGVTLLGTGAFIGISLGSTGALVATAIGTTLTAAKLVLIALYRRKHRRGLSGIPGAGRWELVHGSTTIGFAASVSIIATTAFVAGEAPLEMIATGMLFGYCSGIVARMAIRPVVAALALTIAALPVIIATAIQSGPTHWILAIVFATFLVGSLESVRHVYRVASRQVALRLDMATLARNDPLTGLLNRLGLRQAFREIDGKTGATSMLAVHYFDLDAFKPVNDRHGHPAGDTLLRMLADRIRTTLHTGDIAARIGGDEFVVIQSQIRHCDEADMFARRLARCVTTPYSIGDDTIQIGVSLGFAISPPGTRDLDALLSFADAALYRMKANGGGVAQGSHGAAAA